ncbi:MAG: hypothetical protein AAFW73_22425 [Bacteroidota bacterium]
MQKDLKKVFGNTHGLDEKSVDFLTKALERNNLPGFDYIEFKQALAALEELQMDEATAFKSAYTTAATVGLTKHKLLETAGHYKNVLSKEHQQFAQAMQKQIQQRVGDKKQEVEKLKQQINVHKEKIAQLQEQIARFQHTVDNADAEINQAREKIEKTRNDFEYAHQSILNQIDKDIENINKYL